MKKIIILTVAFASIIIAAVGVYSLQHETQNKPQNQSRLSEPEIREMFRCDRVTADELATDIYCENSEYYYEDVEAGTVIDSSDFEDPRYKAMFSN